jgi:pyruvate,water dikinase
MWSDPLTLPLEEIAPEDLALAGGKGCALARLARAGIAVPATVVVTTHAYQQFVEANGLQEKILLELNRKSFADMRWEEIWDTALRIRNMFLTHPLPAELDRHLRHILADRFAERAVVIRSSAPQEDSAGASFAGIHESYVNVRGLARVIDHLRRVWASLWSDGALLYRQELGLAPASSTMAVLVQELIVGDFSGVTFTVSPTDADQSVIEAVPGLNQGLVDGLVAPARWILDRKTLAVVAHTAADRDQGVWPAKQGVRVGAAPAGEGLREGLSSADVERVAVLARKIETLCQAPQDVEWTLLGDLLTILQARPVTTTATSPGDRRGWYLSLRRSYDNLLQLRARIEDELIPAMVREADELAEVELSRLADAALADEVRRRVDRNQHWSNVYWADFIPYAHGARLFGQIYNDVLKPANPYEFIDLLTDSAMVSMTRNRHLEDLAAALRSAPEAAEDLRHGRWDRLPAAFRASLDHFVDLYGTLSSGITGDREDALADSTLVRLILELAARPLPSAARQPVAQAVLTQRFIDAFAPEERDWARALLDLGRSSYRLRDDDNIYLGRIEAQVHRAVREAQARLGRNPSPEEASLLRDAIACMPSDKPATAVATPDGVSGSGLRARQLVGQPAGPGVARGPVRVVAAARDLKDFQAGEILVCDAVDPNMTFVVPLAAAVVERRGGMLIHGAIIAREYGLPCVTGVPDVLQFIRSGDIVTVDGYLGQVILSSEEN